MSAFPRRRASGLIERSLDGETVVYDQRDDRATHLDAVTSAVWRVCDGRTSIEDVATASRQSRDDVVTALARLHDAGLRDSPGLTRRELVAGAGAVAWTIPLVSIAAPAAAAAASPAVASGFAHYCRGAHTERFDITVSGLPPGQSTLTCSFSPGGSRTATATSTTGTATFSYSFTSTGPPVRSRTVTVVSITLPDGTTQALTGGCP